MPPGKLSQRQVVAHSAGFTTGSAEGGVTYCCEGIE